MKKPDKKNKLQKTKSKIKPSPKGGICVKPSTECGGGFWSCDKG